MKSRNRKDGANSLFLVKLNELLSAACCLLHEDKSVFIVYDIDQFRAGRLVDKLDQCIRNINDIKEELDFINNEIKNERRPLFESDKSTEGFNDQYRYGILTEIVNKKLRDKDPPF